MGLGSQSSVSGNLKTQQKNLYSPMGQEEVNMLGKGTRQASGHSRPAKGAAAEYLGPWDVSRLAGQGQALLLSCIRAGQC